MSQSDSRSEGDTLLAKILNQCRNGVSSSDYKPFVGPVEVNDCDEKSHGRRLFPIKDVKAGELLIRERAFSAVFFSNDSIDPIAITTGGLELEGNDLSVPMVRCALTFDCYQQLLRTPSLRTMFMKLQAGNYCPPSMLLMKVSQDLIGMKFHVYVNTHIEHIVSWNCFSFPASSRDQHCFSTHDPASLREYRASLGLWIQASYMNYTCVPNIQRSFIGDIMVIRAGSDLKAGTELKHSYVDISKNYAERQNELRGYGFQCCSLCSAWVNTPHKKRKKRENTRNFIRDRVVSSVPTELSDFFRLLDNLEWTYIHPAAEEPRIETVLLLMKLITDFSSEDQSWGAFWMVYRLLDNLGFKFIAYPGSFTIQQWGYVDEFVVLALVAIWKAYGSCGPTACNEVETAVKAAYGMVVGETDSFEATHGSARPDFTNWNSSTAPEDYPPNSLIRNWDRRSKSKNAESGRA